MSCHACKDKPMDRLCEDCWKEYTELKGVDVVGWDRISTTDNDGREDI